MHGATDDITYKAESTAFIGCKAQVGPFSRVDRFATNSEIRDVYAMRGVITG